MDRKEFIKVCGGTCLGLLGISLLESCAGTHYVQATSSDNKLTVLLDEFKVIKKNQPSFRKHIVVKTEKSDYPIVVYRYSDTDYRAMLMRCTHQGIELSINGDILSCSAHGSEFSNKGDVINGPADQKLKTFPVSADEKNIYIQLT
jgi:Rieske Fe-S protein